MSGDVEDTWDAHTHTHIK